MNRIQPLHIDGLSDFHVHCDYSIDASGTIEEYCEAALERGLAEICFTTHYDSNPRSDGFANYIRIGGEKKPATPENLAPYVNDVMAAQEKFYPLGLSVKLGLEFGWYPHCEEKVTRIKEWYDFDHLMAGVHEIKDICFCAASTYEQCFANLSMEEAVADYFKQVCDAARSGLFNTVAHLDYYRKYGEQVYGPAIHRAHLPHMDAVFAALTEGRTAIEINTAARRKGLDSYFPSMELINSAKRAGVEITTLGSDAHAPTQVGYDFETAAHLIPQQIGGCDE
ncbi:MAG: histidinol-phosphatase HisJ family protein [bacterium]|nr:histidinol-phosphatase HisJ family protein [bacterium]